MPERLNMPLHRVETQARVCAAAVLNVLRRSLLEHRPADRMLREEFHANRQFGSRDRRLISETLFSLVRWWGWLNKFAPEDFVQAWHQSLVQNSVPLPFRAEVPFDMPVPQWLPTLAAAWLLDNLTADVPAAVELWCNQANLPPKVLDGPAGDTLEARRNYLKYWGRNIDFSDSALLPEWVFSHLAFLDKSDLAKLIEWQQRRPPVWLRGQISDRQWLINRLHSEDLDVEPHRVMDNALKVLSPATNICGLKSFKDGDIEIQDISSQTIALVCAPEPGQQWWDTCAGGGGKTLQLAWLMDGKGSVMATDIRTHKLEELKLRARRAEFPNIRYKEWKGKAMPNFRERFDGVLVDAPCSCTGTWRRNPDRRWTTSADDISGCAALQRQILENAAPGVKKGGVLIYATCSMLPAENRNVVDAFLAKHDDFKLMPFTCPLTGRQTDGTSQLYPWDGDGDSMFAAKFIRM